MSKLLGRITYEARYVIIQVPDEWGPGDPLPAASTEDRWFENLSDFVAALNAPWDHAPINRHPWDHQQERPVPPKRSLGRLS